MAIVNGYITLEELKNHIMASGVGTFTDADDANMETAINAISRLVDSLNSTNFYGATETRYLTSRYADLLHLDDDLISITTLKTDSTNNGTYDEEWATTDYYLEPRNARVKANAADREPYRQIRINPNGDYTFPRYEYGIEIAGVWGYTTEPPAFVKNAVLLAAHHVWRRKDSIFGIAGAPALGVQIIQARIQQDTDVVMLLSGLNKRGW